MNQMSMDASPLSSSPSQAPPPQRLEIPCDLSLNAREYNMSHSKRGKAIIFNHYFLGQEGQRSGSHIDVRMLRDRFTAMGFTVQVYDGLEDKLTKRMIMAILKDVADNKDGENVDADCLVVVVMTHGDLNRLQASDTTYNVSNLWDLFTADKCPSLARKPKLFFIQACRGESRDVGVRLRTEQDGGTASTTYTIPATSDFFVAQATFEGHVAFRRGTGSPFIQALCSELEESGDTKEICQILTSVNRKVAIAFQSVPSFDGGESFKQMPNFWSSLTMELYFRPN